MHLTRRFPLCLVLLATLPATRPVLAFDWAPITQAEKALVSSPLDPGSGAIVLFRKGRIQVEERTNSLWLTTIETYTRIKILNEAGRDFANVSFESSKGVRLKDVTGRTILPSGEIVPLDKSQIFRGTVYESGDRAIVETSFAFPAVEPGSIVEYQIVETVDWFFFPPWIFEHGGLATLDSSLTVVVAQKLSLLQFPLETSRKKLQVTESRSARGNEYHYQARNLAPIRDERHAVPFREQALSVVFAPHSIGVLGGGAIPILERWNDVAELFSNIFKEVKKKRGKAKEQARSLVANIKDKQKRAETIYRFLQRNVASTGIRGVGTVRRADDVLTSRQGDPDEINMLYAIMLEEAKVKADLVLVPDRSWQMLIGVFPNISQLARVITRIRDESLFVDAADASVAFGALPWYETGITGLVVKGKKLEQEEIPLASSDENVKHVSVTSELSPDGVVSSEVEMSFKGSPAFRFRALRLEQSPEELDESLENLLGLGLPSPQVTDIRRPDFHDTSKELVLKAKLAHRLFDETEGQSRSQILLNPWVGARMETPVFKESQRSSAVRFPFLETHSSTSTWRFPDPVQVLEIPEEVNLETDFATFSHACRTTDEGEVTCERKYILKKLELTTSKQYFSAKKFFEEVVRHDQEVILLEAN